MVPIKLIRSLFFLCIFLILIVNPNVWGIAGFTVPVLSDYRDSVADSIDDLAADLGVDSVADLDVDSVVDLDIDFGFIFRLICFIVHMGIYKTIFGAFVASIVFFIYRSVVFKDTSVDKMCRDPKAPAALKKWKNIPKTILFQYLVILIQCILWAVVFVLGLLFDVLPEGFYMKGFVLGSVMAIVNIVPIYFKMWIESTYPNKLLAIQSAKGIIGNYIMGFTLVYMIWDLPFGKELTFCNCLWPFGNVPFPFSLFCDLL